MADPKNIWLIDAQGTYARVAENKVDDWKPLGWDVADEPAYDSAEVMVWLQHEITGGRQRFAAPVVPQWQALGWHPTAPPAPVDLTRDPQLTDPAEEPASHATPKKSTTKAASGGSNKES